MHRVIVVAVALAAALSITTVGFVSSAGAATHPSHSAHLQSAFQRTTSIIRIYLVAIGDRGRSGKPIGCGDSLVAVNTRIAPTAAPLRAAMQALLNDHHRFLGQSGLYNSLFQSRLRVEKVQVASGRATIFLAGRMRLGGVCDSPRFGGQLRQTALQFPSVRNVKIFINRIPMSTALSGKGG